MNVTPRDELICSTPSGLMESVRFESTKSTRLSLGPMKDSSASADGGFTPTAVRTVRFLGDWRQVLLNQLSRRKSV